MTIFKKCGCILGSAALLLILGANTAFSEEASAEEEDGEITNLTFPISSPVLRISLSPKILATMRTNLMGVMGIEPDVVTPEDNKKSNGH